MTHELHRYTMTLDGQPPEDLGELSTDDALSLVRQRVEQSGRRVTWGPMGWNPTGLDGVDELFVFAWTDQDNTPRYCGVLHRKN